MKKWKQGSFTVEAAMIMGVVLLVIMAVLQGSIFVYKRAVETAQQYEKEIIEWVEEPDPVTYIRQMQAIKEMTGGE